MGVCSNISVLSIICCNSMGLQFDMVMMMIGERPAEGSMAYRAFRCMRLLLPSTSRLGTFTEYFQAEKTLAYIFDPGFDPWASALNMY